MSRKLGGFFSAASVLTLAVALGSGEGYAQQQEQATPRAEDEIIVTGTRRENRSAADSPSPIDVISGSDFVQGGTSDVQDLLRTSVPSFNVNTQPINDAATLVRPANLRGLASDQTLVLLNGKRRHRSAVITFLGNGVSDGSQAPDISTVPSIALKQIEVLRDGASAQYGSDAIAGVINFILDDSSEGLDVSAKLGTTYEGDGTSVYLGIKKGFSLADSGYLTLAAEGVSTDDTDRAVQRDDAQALIDGGNRFVRVPAQDWGQPKIFYDTKFSANLGISVGDTADFYAFANYAKRRVESGFYYRNPDTRSGVFVTTEDDGRVRRLVAAETLDDGTLADCPVSYVGAADDAANLVEYRNNDNCFAFNERFPGGFTPNFGGRLSDVGGAFGFRGEALGGLRYDLSVNAGRSEVRFYLTDTVNASLGPDSPKDFDTGTYVQLENSFNADFAYATPVEYFASDLNIAFGAEYRVEQFEVKPGEESSFIVGPYVDQGFSIGSNGFNGFTPISSGVFDRSNYSLYLDLEADVTQQLTVSGALRFEDYEDFGSTIKGKIAALYKITDMISVRGTYSTGFRAPTPGQTKILNVTTSLTENRLTNVGTIPPDSELAIALGSQGVLGPEESESFTLGAAVDADFGSVTIDYYHIDLEDRIAQSSNFFRSQSPTLGDVFDAANADEVRFYTNDFDTTTQGIDVVATLNPYEIGKGSLKASLLYNYNKTEVTARSSAIANIRVKQLEDGLPNHRAVLSANYLIDAFDVLARVNYVSETFEAAGSAEDADGNAAFPQDIGAMFTLDLAVTYDFNDYTKITVGADNILDEFPDESQYGSVLGLQYPETSPLGYSGGFYYVRVDMKF